MNLAVSVAGVLGDFDRGGDGVFVGCSIAELAASVVAPCPGVAVGVYRDRMVGTGRDLDEFVSAGYLHWHA